MRPFWLAACLSLSLAACSSTPTQYYRLPDSAFSLPERNGTATTVQVVLAPHLGSSSLVYQNDALNLSFARNHLWAEPLDLAIAKHLANRLNRLPNRYSFYSSDAFPTTASAASAPQLTVYIESFQGSYHGHTRIQGYSRWRHAPAGGQNFDIRTPQQGDGYAAMTESLAQGLDALAHTLNPTR